MQSTCLNGLATQQLILIPRLDNVIGWEGGFEPPKAYAVGSSSRSVVLDMEGSELLEGAFINLNCGEVVFNLYFFFGCMV